MMVESRLEGPVSWHHPNRRTILRLVGFAGMACTGTAWPGTAWPGTAWPGTAWPGTVVAAESLGCARCGRALTGRNTATERAGAHAHTFTNPQGVTFDIGCFTEAPGAVAMGTPTEAHTWFSGHRWRAAVCGGCRQHVGWRFDGATGAFWALIIDRLATPSA